ncbi:helix-hairpin-helix domain-containing protein [Ottowia sp.]|uniref:ComEA family DNA-binding protein n=1 Tax=Ottowia sp. TaxID=1898956 RepID=UPI002B69B171|nr:helix-hairpin-helix domain-containing protein [Ottowia sp.]HOB65988.1 helix-hairpin-helix domain-containing protein [Ottowia sp.]HPZ56098.1 helix-hairpin-helix domain-containing protein [Ottowia sp.]HQD46763.1 helix-hairpin-helix domain-containing protein [Ottowia sp.]
MNRSNWIKRALAVCTVALAMTAAHAGVDVNTAPASELDAVRHVSRGLSKRIVAERHRAGPYKDWTDLIKRVRGIDNKSAARLSDAGLLVQGVTYTGSRDGGQSPAAAAAPTTGGAVGGQPTVGKDAANTPMSPPTIGAPAPATPAREAAKP